MFGLAARVGAVFALWGAVLAAALAGGVTPQLAEPLAGAGAGLTLMAWGVLAARPRPERHPAGEPAVVHERAKASV